MWYRVSRVTDEIDIYWEDIMKIKRLQGRLLSGV